MNELKVLMAKDETMRQLVGLYEEEKERADAAERKLKDVLESMSDAKNVGRIIPAYVCESVIGAAKIKEMESIIRQCKDVLIKYEDQMALRDSGDDYEFCEMYNDLEIILGRFDEESR